MRKMKFGYPGMKIISPKRAKTQTIGGTASFSSLFQRFFMFVLLFQVDHNRIEIRNLRFVAGILREIFFPVEGFDLVPSFVEADCLPLDLIEDVRLVSLQEEII